MRNRRRLLQIIYVNYNRLAYKETVNEIIKYAITILFLCETISQTVGVVEVCVYMLGGGKGEY